MARSRLLDSNLNPRLIAIREADTIHYWSIKHQQIFTVSPNNFREEYKPLHPCLLYIPRYHASAQSSECKSKFNSLDKLKTHISICEYTFARELMWANSKYNLISR